MSVLPQGESGFTGLELEVVIGARSVRFGIIQQLEVILVSRFVHAECRFQVCLEHAHVEEPVPFLLAFLHYRQQLGHLFEL